MIKNQDIRQACEVSGVKLWQVADRLKLNDGNFSRRLRHELSDAEKKKILGIIKEISKEVE